MASDFYQRDDLSIYVVAGVPRSFKSTLAGIVKETAGESGDMKLVNGEMTEWLLAKLRENGRRSHERTPASAALWRAFRALSAARYHLHDETMEDEVREIRERIEKLWNRASPMMRMEDGAEAEAG